MSFGLIIEIKLFEKNQLFPVKRLLEVRNPDLMDAMTRAAFRASSGALVMALLHDGASYFWRVAASEDPGVRCSPVQFELAAPPR